MAKAATHPKREKTQPSAAHGLQRNALHFGVLSAIGLPDFQVVLSKAGKGILAVSIS